VVEVAEPHLLVLVSSCHEARVNVAEE
jgi:hypothetical protein